MNAQEKKCLAVFVVLLSAFYEMVESEEAKQEFIKILEIMKQKAKMESEQK